MEKLFVKLQSFQDCEKIVKEFYNNNWLAFISAFLEFHFKLKKKLKVVELKLEQFEKGPTQKNKNVKRDVKPPILVDFIDNKNFSLFLANAEIVSSSAFTRNREKIALTLFLIFSFTLDDLLLVRIQNVLDLFTYGTTVFVGTKRIFGVFSLSAESMRLLKEIEVPFLEITKNQNPNNYLFSTSKNRDKRISKDAMASSLNRIFNKTSIQIGKNFRIKSFEIRSIARDLINPCLHSEEIQKKYGHRTLVYTLKHRRYYQKVLEPYGGDEMRAVEEIIANENSKVF